MGYVCQRLAPVQAPAIGPRHSRVAAISGALIPTQIITGVGRAGHRVKAVHQVLKRHRAVETRAQGVHVVLESLSSTGQQVEAASCLSLSASAGHLGPMCLYIEHFKSQSIYYLGTWPIIPQTLIDPF